MREELHLKVVVLKFRLTVEPVASLSAVFWMSRKALRDIQKNIQKTAARETIEPAAKAQKIFAIQPTRRESTILKLSAEYSLKLKKKIEIQFLSKNPNASLALYPEFHCTGGPLNTSLSYLNTESL